MTTVFDWICDGCLHDRIDQVIGLFQEYKEVIAKWSDARLYIIQTYIAKSCSIPLVEALIAIDAPVVTGEVYAIFLGACRTGNYDFVRFLIYEFANHIHSYRSGLEFACQSNNLELVKYIYSLMPTPVEFSYNCIISYEVFKFIYEKSVEANATINTYLLYLSAWRSSDLRILEFIDARHKMGLEYGYTPYMYTYYAAECGITNMKLLISRVGINMIRDGWYGIALDGCNNGNLEVVEYAYENDSRVFDNRGFPIMLNACQGGSLEVVKFVWAKCRHANINYRDLIRRVCNYKHSSNIIKFLLDIYPGPIPYNVNMSAVLNYDEDLLREMLARFTPHQNTGYLMMDETVTNTMGAFKLLIEHFGSIAVTDNIIHGLLDLGLPFKWFKKYKVLTAEGQRELNRLLGRRRQLRQIFDATLPLPTVLINITVSYIGYH